MLWIVLYQGPASQAAEKLSFPGFFSSLCNRAVRSLILVIPTEDFSPSGGTCCTQPTKRFDHAYS